MANIGVAWKLVVSLEMQNVTKSKEQSFQFDEKCFGE